jgi:hypothetical protein
MTYQQLQLVLAIRTADSKRKDHVIAVLAGALRDKP